MQETAVIKFNNGTELNVSVNGTTYIAETKPTFPNDLSHITITKDECDFIIDYGKIVETSQGDDRYWFTIIDVPESERSAKQVRADVDYIAMELDIDL